MRFEVSYPTGVTHEVEPAGPTAVLGRDPGCDVVLNDTKCSRRHAIVEEVDGQLVLRDTGSANGIYVNGRRVDSAVLAPGDAVKLGDVQLRVLAEGGATVITESDAVPLPDAPLDAPPVPEMPVGTPRAGRPPLRSGPPALRPAPPPEPRRPASPRPPRPPYPPGRAAGGRATVVTGEPERPLTVTLIAGLWALFVPGSVATVLYAASRAGAGPGGWAAAAALGAAFAGLGVAMGLGLRSLAPWSYRMQIAAAGVGLVVCPFTLASVTVLLYMSRPEVKDAFFSGRRGGPGAGASEPTFAMSILGMLGLGLAVCAVALMLAGPAR
jgi:pSer/pThr/pTyr-binding forkhead associated (FHA) protein